MRKWFTFGAGLSLLAGSALAAAESASAAGIVFEDCDLLDRDGVPRAEAQCARFEVPENPAAPDGR